MKEIKALECQTYSYEPVHDIIYNSALNSLSFDNNIKQYDRNNQKISHMKFDDIQNDSL